MYIVQAPVFEVFFWLCLVLLFHFSFVAHSGFIVAYFFTCDILLLEKCLWNHAISYVLNQYLLDGSTKLSAWTSY